MMAFYSRRDQRREGERERNRVREEEIFLLDLSALLAPRQSHSPL